MGACCSKTTDNDSHFNVDNNAYTEVDKVNIKKEMHKLKDDLTSNQLNSSYYSDQETNNDLTFRRIEIEKNRKFCYDLVKEINIIRTKPQSYLKKIEYFEQFVKILSNDSLLFEYEGNVYGINNIDIFEEASNSLDPNVVYQPLKIKDELVINLPIDTGLIQKYDYMANQFVMKKIGLSNKYSHFSFHYDVTNRNAELSAFFQFIDDLYDNRLRRKNLLNPNYNSIGVSVGKITDQKYYCYIVLAG